MVLVCVSNAGVRELIGLLIEHAACTVIPMDVYSWLAGDAVPEPPADVIILDAWPSVIWMQGRRHRCDSPGNRPRLSYSPIARRI